MIVKETGQEIEGEKIHHLTKRYIDWSLFNKRKCINCGENIVSKNSTSISQRDDEIIVNCDLDYGNYKAVRCKKCIPKLNSNSFKYNMLKFGISEEEARKLIHGRNKSPFYESNHDSHESYRKFQSHDDFSDERKTEIQRKQDESRAKWQEKFIEKYGYEAFKKVKDSSSEEHFREKYGDDWKFYYDKKCEKTRKKTHTEILEDTGLIIRYLEQKKCNTEKGIKRYFENVTRYSSIVSKIHLLLSEIPNKYTMRFICWKKLYGEENLFNVLNMTKQRIFIEKRVIPGNKGYVYTGSINGNFLRSGQEIDFYRKLEENNIEIVNTNRSYQKSGRQFYDFKILCKNGIEHIIELIGNNENKYKQKLLFREKEYGAILVSKEYIDNFITDMKNGKDITKGKYNDW